jgi:hypothetical protein
VLSEAGKISLAYQFQSESFVFPHIINLSPSLYEKETISVRKTIFLPFTREAINIPSGLYSQ